MYKNKKHTNSNKLIAKTLSVVFGMLTILMFAQKSAENTLLKTISNQNVSKNANKSTFFSDTPIYISNGAIVSLQLEDIQFNKEVFGEGLLHLANTPTIKIQSLTPIRVDNIKVENTKLQLKTDIQFTGTVTLANATVWLNEYNLTTENNVIFKDNNSNIIENSTGLWFKKQTSFSKSSPYNSITSNNNNIITALFYTNTLHFNKLSALASKIETKSALNPYNFYQVPKPPPRFV